MSHTRTTDLVHDGAGYARELDAGDTPHPRRHHRRDFIPSLVGRLEMIKSDVTQYSLGYFILLVKSASLDEVVP